MFCSALGSASQGIELDLGRLLWEKIYKWFWRICLKSFVKFRFGNVHVGYVFSSLVLLWMCVCRRQCRCEMKKLEESMKFSTDNICLMILNFHTITFILTHNYRSSNLLNLIMHQCRLNWVPFMCLLNICLF